ncbi:MAG: hypothetical protein Greene101415_323 [Parcubacteria group bacterium Greene1014_15]|nr:MAG: hypothetical protein Greene101415_323 [Parcubacteria group bacterium Greene1014_15]
MQHVPLFRDDSWEASAVCEAKRRVGAVGVRTGAAAYPVCGVFRHAADIKIAR